MLTPASKLKTTFVSWDTKAEKLAPRARTLARLTQDVPQQRMYGARRPLLTDEIIVFAYTGRRVLLEGKQKGRSPMIGNPGPIVVVVGEEKLLLPIVGPVPPSLVGEVATEEASHLFRSRFPAVEKTSRCEVVRLLVD